MKQSKATKLDFKLIHRVIAGWKFPDNTVEQLVYRKMVEDGGGDYVGIQECKGFPRRTAPENLVLFNSPKTGSTLALRLSEVTSEAVARHLAMHEDKWARVNAPVLPEGWDG